MDRLDEQQVSSVKRDVRPERPDRRRRFARPDPSTGKAAGLTLRTSLVAGLRTLRSAEADTTDVNAPSPCVVSGSPDLTV